MKHKPAVPKGDLGLSAYKDDAEIARLLAEDGPCLDPESTGGYLEDKVVLVTGAGGSIGSELCRQICRCRPQTLLLLGRGEYAIFQIHRELAARYPDQRLVCVLADVRDPRRIAQVFRQHAPQIVFHTAAYKHVSLVEENPEEGIRNNVFGMHTVARLALRFKVERFVFISSDKAVLPVSVMGASKRIAELIMADLAGSGATEFVTVRFANIIRSRGSAVPIFEDQIDRGAGLVLTHPDMVRYFMSKRQAVQLVLQSPTVCASGDLCVLDMGKPVRVADLLRVLVASRRDRRAEDVEIRYSGPKPGEKLVERLFTEEEERRIERKGGMLVCRADPSASKRVRRDELVRLKWAATHYRRDLLIELLAKIVPEYTPSA